MMDTSNSLYYLKYTMDGKQKETNELVSLDTARLEKREFEADGAKNVQIVPNRSVSSCNPLITHLLQS